VLLSRSRRPDNISAYSSFHFRASSRCLSRSCVLPMCWCVGLSGVPCFSFISSESSLRGDIIVGVAVSLCRRWHHRSTHHPISSTCHCRGLPGCDFLGGQLSGGQLVGQLVGLAGQQAALADREGYLGGSCLTERG
jgi:hypothetical protein